MKVAIILGVLVLLLGGCTAACIAMTGEAANELVDEIDKSITENEADVNDDVQSCEIVTDDIGLAAARVVVTNDSSKMSDYSFQIRVEDADGNRVGEGFGGASSVKAGETASEDVYVSIDDDSLDPSALVCEVTDTGRLATS